MDPVISYSTQEIARTVGVPAHRIAYHVRSGSLPSPRVWAGRWVFSRQDMEVIQGFFANRKRYQHT